MPHMFLCYRVCTMFYFEANSTFILSYVGLYICLPPIWQLARWAPISPWNTYFCYYIWAWLSKECLAVWLFCLDKALIWGLSFPGIHLDTILQESSLHTPIIHLGLSLSCLSMQGRSCRILKQVGRLRALFVTKNKAKSKV